MAEMRYLLEQLGVQTQSIFLDLGGASARLEPHHDGGWCISGVFVPPQLRRQGQATALLRKVVEAADIGSYTLRLTVEPIGRNPPLSARQLIRWYKRLGFRLTGRGYDMIRLAKRD